VYFVVVLELGQLRDELLVKPGLVVVTEANCCVVLLRVVVSLVWSQTSAQEHVEHVVYVHLATSAHATSEHEHKAEKERNEKQKQEEEIVVRVGLLSGVCHGRTGGGRRVAYLLLGCVLFAILTRGRLW